MSLHRATAIVALAAFPVTARVRAQARSTPRDTADTAEATAPPPAPTVGGSAATASDDRFRGVARPDRDVAVQGGIAVSHRSGPGAGTGTIAGGMVVVAPTAAVRPSDLPTFRKDI